MTVRSHVKAWWPVIATGGVLVAGGLVAIPLGGWDTVELQSDDIPQQELGQPYAGTQWKIAIDEVSLADEHPDGFTEHESGEAFLIVAATMENLRSEPAYPFTSSSIYPFTIPGLVELGVTVPFDRHTVMLARDASFGPLLNRGVPDTVLFVFTVASSDFAPGDEVRIGLTDGTAEAADLYEGTRWIDVHTAVEVVTELGEQR